MAIPEFIVDLRRKVGTELLWLPGVTAVVLDDERVLLVRRADNGQWTAVTGIMDPGEHPVETAQREVLEETGVHCSVEGLAWVSVTAPKVYPNGDRAQYLDLTFRCRYLAGHAHVADDESSEVAWFPIDALPQMSRVQTERIATAVAHTGPTRLTPMGR